MLRDRFEEPGLLLELAVPLQRELLERVGLESVTCTGAAEEVRYQPGQELVLELHEVTDDRSEIRGGLLFRCLRDARLDPFEPVVVSHRESALELLLRADRQRPCFGEIIP